MKMMITNKYGKIKKGAKMSKIKTISILCSSFILFGCGGGGGDSSADNGSSTGSASGYNVSYPNSVDLAAGVQSKLFVNVESHDLGEIGKVKAHQYYSVEIIPNAAYISKNACVDLKINEACELLVTTTIEQQVAEVAPLELKITFPDGGVKRYQTEVGIAPLSLAPGKNAVLPLNKQNYISISNSGTKNAVYFDETPKFTDANGNVLNVNLEQNTCSLELAAGKSCELYLSSDVKLSGQLRLMDYGLQVANFGFSEVGVIGDKSKDIPANVTKGTSYPFTYVFTNLSGVLKATGVRFENVFPESEGVKIDLVGSTCNGVTELAPRSSCVWKGTFTPDAVETTVEISSSIFYDEGLGVNLTSVAQVVEVVVSGVKTIDIPSIVAVGQSYPFVYTFSNTHSTLPATGIDFENTISEEDGFILNQDESTCQGVTELTPKSSCEWKGVFAPVKAGANVTLASVLSYAEGVNIVLQSHSKELLPTTPINSGPDVDEDGWSWPDNRFQALKQGDNIVCEDAVQDQLTGLVWARDGEVSGRRLWSDAMTYADNLELCGYSDWRLPTINELKTLVQITGSGADWLNNHGFHNIDETMHYWSSTPYLGIETADWWWSESGSTAWVASFSNRNDITDQLTRLPIDVSQYLLLPVRGKSGTTEKAVVPSIGPDSSGGEGSWPTPRFSNVDKVGEASCSDALYDELTGLMWGKADLNRTVKFTEAMSMANNSTLCGYSNWRLPTYGELHSLVNLAYVGAWREWINNNSFNLGSSDYYWTSSVKPNGEFTLINARSGLTHATSSSAGGHGNWGDIILVRTVNN